MKGLNYSCLLIIILSGCNSTQRQVQPSDPLAKEIKLLSWLNYADSIEDAKAAMKLKDYRLLAIGNQEPQIPGVEPQDTQRALKNCRLRYMTGMTVNIVNLEHQLWWQRGYSYAKEYNELIMSHCL